MHTYIIDLAVGDFFVKKMALQPRVIVNCPLHKIARNIGTLLGGGPFQFNELEFNSVFVS